MEIADRVRETTYTSGLSSYGLAGADRGYIAFSSAFLNGATVRYAVAYGNDFEIGRGVYNAGTISRDTIYRSSNGGQKVNWGQGTKKIWANANAELLWSAESATEDLAAHIAHPDPHPQYEQISNLRSAAYYAATAFLLVASLGLPGEIVAGTMATQNANNVAVTGGTINGAVIGGVTPAAGTFTDLTVQGNLVLHGTSTTVNSTVVTLDDPILTLGGDTDPTVDDNKDRGIEFRWHNGAAAKRGFFGWDDSASAFVFIPDATNSSEVFSGAAGDAIFAGVTTTNLQATGGTISGLTSLLIGTGTGTQGGNDNLIKTGASSAFLNIKGGSGKAKIAIGNESLVVIGGDSGGAVTFTSGATSDTNTGTARLQITDSGRIRSGLTLPADDGATGWQHSGSMSVSTTLSIGGPATRLTASGLVARSSGSMSWNPNDSTATTPDLVVVRDAPNTLAQRNGITAQIHRIYNTFTDSSNYERAELEWSGNIFTIKAVGAGTGSNRVLRLQSGAAGQTVQCEATFVEANSGAFGFATERFTRPAANQLQLNSSELFLAGGTAGATSIRQRITAPRAFSNTLDGSILAFTASNGTLGQHDFGAIVATNNPGTTHGGAAIVELRVGGNSTQLTSLPNSVFVMGKAETDVGGVSEVSLNTAGTQRVIVNAAGRVRTGAAIGADDGSTGWQHYGTMSVSAGFVSNASVTVQQNSSQRWVIFNINGVAVRQGQGIGWSNSTTDAGGGITAGFYSPASNVVEQRNSTNAQTFRVYGTYTDASNYRCLEIVASSAAQGQIIRATGAGTGAGANLNLQAVGGGGRVINFGTSSTTFWHINTAGHWFGETDNTYDIGASGATRPRTGYFGTSIFVPQINSDGSRLRVGGAADDGSTTVNVNGTGKFSGNLTLSSQLFLGSATTGGNPLIAGIANSSTSLASIVSIAALRNTDTTAGNFAPLSFQAQTGFGIGVIGAKILDHTSGNEHGNLFLATRAAAGAGIFERLTITHTGNIHTPAGATNMAAGFIHIPSAAGVPTGVPTNPTGTVPLYYDAANDHLYAYSGAAWKKVALAA